MTSNLRERPTVGLIRLPIQQNRPTVGLSMGAEPMPDRSNKNIERGQATREQLIAAAEGTTDPVAGLRAGCLAWVRLAADPVVQRILLIDAPSVLGWQRWRAMEEDRALGGIKAILLLIAKEGKLR